MDVEHRLLIFESSIVSLSCLTALLFFCFALVPWCSSTLPTFCEGPDEENCVARGVFPGTKWSPPVPVWSKKTGRLGARRFMTEKRTSMTRTMAMLIEVKVQSSANRLAGRMKSRLITAHRQALRVVRQYLVPSLLCVRRAP
jgi:hypothetical protein